MHLKKIDLWKSNKRLTSFIRNKILGAISRFPGYDKRNWLRIRQIEAFEKILQGNPEVLVFEVSPGWNKYWKSRCKNYKSADYPEFDICKQRMVDQFDIVIVDQVLEHVADPERAIRNIHAMIKPGGLALIATPFLFRVHARPHDFTRWTQEGLVEILARNGFEKDCIQADSWGNKACARAHIGGPVRDYGFWRSLENDSEYPLQVWAVARVSVK